jgi:magnesium transporter
MDEVRVPPIGARPGTLAIDPDAPPPRLRAICYDDERMEELTPQNLEEVERLRRSGGKLWLDVQGLGDERLLRGLGELFSIHPLALEDVVHAPVRPKSEVYEHNLLVIGRMLRSTEDDAVDTEQIGIVIGQDYVLTFQEAYGDVLDPVRKRLQLSGSAMRRLGPDYVAYAIQDTIIDAYFPVIERLGDWTEALEERVLSEGSHATLRDLTVIKGTLLRLRHAVVPQREAVRSLIHGESELVSERVRMYFRDTYDHIVQTVDAVEMARELVNGLMNTYMSVVSNRMNDVMKTLTIVASIFVPLTFVAGVYGMNFQHMPELHARWSYPIVLGAMAVLAIGMLVYFRRKGWIGTRKQAPPGGDS